jgi:uncharacterized protein YbjT (DUF2867 family)
MGDRGVDRVEGNAHCAGKREQERVALAGSVPATIVRATQFFDFAAMVVGWTRRGQVATVPPLLVQPVAVADVADVLVQVALGAPQNGVRELAGPDHKIWSMWLMGRSPHEGSRCG